jgi:hypothetical protein
MRQICQYMDNFIFSILLKQNKGLGNKSNQWCMAEVIQQLEEILCRVSPFAELYKCWKGLQGLRGYSTYLNKQQQQNAQSTYVLIPMPVEIWEIFEWSIQQMLHVVPMHFNTTFSSSSTEVRTLSTIPGLNRIFWHAFSIHCCNTSEVIDRRLIHQSFRWSQSQKSRALISGDRVGQLTAPPPPMHCSPKVWFRRCLTVRRKWVSGPSYMNHMSCR